MNAMNDKNLELKRKMNSGKMFASVADFVAAVCFFAAYVSTDEMLFLVMAAVLFVSGFAIIIIFSKLEKRFTSIMDSSQLDNDSQQNFKGSND